MRKYTVSDNRFVYNKIEDIHFELTQGIHEAGCLDMVEALILGGGYGRGEGGVCYYNKVPQLYNDLEYYLFWKPKSNPSAQQQKKISEFAEYLTNRHGIEVEIFQTSASWLDTEPVTIFTYDLVSKSHIVFGDSEFLSPHDRHRDPSLIQISEAERLMYNRLSGILFSLEKINRGVLTHYDNDFICRNIAKLKLAMGDACLTVFGNYHWSCTQRNKSLKSFFDYWVLFDPSTQDQIVEFHNEGVAFKMSPQIKKQSLKAWLAEVDSILKVAEPVWAWSRSESAEFRAVRNRMGLTHNIVESIKDRIKNIHYFGISDSINPYNKLSARERLQKCLWELIINQRFQWNNFQNNQIPKLLNMLPEEDSNLINRYQLLWNQLG